MENLIPIQTQSIGEIDRLIRAAIIEKAPLQVIYDGAVRLLCPYMLGRNREGRVRILCLQMGGTSSGGLKDKDYDNWRCLALEKFSSVEPVATAWQTAGSALRRPKCIDQIELEITNQPAGEPQ